MQGSANIQKGFSNWIADFGDPTADVRSALSRINPDAAVKLIEIYLDERSSGEPEM